MRALIISVAIIGALAAVQPASAQVKANKAYCLIIDGSGPGGAKEECRYDTMAQCEQSMKGLQGSKCEKNKTM